MKFVFRVLCLPLVVICYAIKWFAIMTMKCGCYILSPVLCFLGLCCVITIIRQQWNQALLLLILGFTGVLFLTAVTLIAIIAQDTGLAIERLCNKEYN